jgi:hypothetical protein
VRKIHRAPAATGVAAAVDTLKRKRLQTILPAGKSKVVAVWEWRRGPADVQFQIATSAPPIDQSLLCAARLLAFGILEGVFRPAAIPAVMAMVEDGIRLAFSPCRIIARIKIGSPERPGWLP